MRKINNIIDGTLMKYMELEETHINMKNNKININSCIQNIVLIKSAVPWRMECIQRNITAKSTFS